MEEMQVDSFLGCRYSLLSVQVGFGGVKSWLISTLGLTAGMRLRKEWARQTLA